MCYPKPGPRCAAHTRAELKEAKKAYRADPTSENYNKVDQAQRNFDSTPGGSAVIKNDIIELTRSREVPDRRTRTGVRVVPKVLSEDEKTTLSLLKKRLKDGQELRAEQKRALDNVQGAASAIAAGRKPPILVSKNHLREPQPGVTYAIEYDYDSHYNDYYDGTSSDYQNITDIRIESIDLPRVLAESFETSPAHITSNLIDYAKSIGLDEDESYETDTEMDYYGDRVYVGIEQRKLKNLKDYYFTQDNAEDREGVLSYARSKGTETSGLAPLDAIKKQLEEEKGNLPRSVVQSTKVTQESISLSKITIPSATKMRNADSKEAYPYGGSAKIAGVLLKKDDGYVLLDGYSRTKDLVMKNKKKFNYLILS